MANIADNFTRASITDRAEYPTLAAQKNIGDSSLTASSLTNWPTSTAVHFILYQVDINNNEVVGTRSEWKGVVSGSTVINLELTAGTDQIYPIGSILQVVPTSGWANDLVDGLQVVHELNGQLKANVIGNTNILDGAVTSAKLVDAFLRGSFQADTTNSNQTGLRLQAGWGYIAGTGASPATKTVTFPTAYSVAPLFVIPASLGYKSGGSAPTSISDFNQGHPPSGAWIPAASNITNTNFVMSIARDADQSWSATDRAGFAWVALGVV